MAYGIKYHLGSNRLHTKEGVFYGNITGKWLVRVKRKTGGFTTIGSYDTEKEANKIFKKHK